MTISSTDISRLRRMINELTTDNYSDVDLSTYIAAYPKLDQEGRTIDDDDWAEAYDLHAAASDIWEEKAAAVQSKHDFSADGASFSSSQMYQNAMDQARYHAAKRVVTTRRVHKSPDEGLDTTHFGPIVNIDEPGEDGLEMWEQL